MMPIVDPHAEISCDEFTLDTYLAQSSAFHILRMVAVQQPQVADKAIAEISNLHIASRTRGSGGLPNKLVAYCDLMRPGAVSGLLDSDIDASVCGVNFVCTPGLIKDDGQLDKTILKIFFENVKLIDSHELSLDIALSTGECHLIDILARQFPSLTIVVTLQDWAEWLNTSNIDQCKELFVSLAKHEGVYLKIVDSLCGQHLNNAELLDKMVSLSVQLFGYDRIMFATGERDLQANPVAWFDDRWNSYLDAASTFAALNRDKLFRSNAIRVYGL